MSEDLKSYLSKYLEEKPETVKAFGCNFGVYRHNKDKGKKLISVSLWKGSPGYVYSLQMSLLSWIQLVNTYFKGWYIRFYIDANIFKPFTLETRESTRDQIYQMEWDKVANDVKNMIDTRLAMDQTSNRYELFDALKIDREKPFFQRPYDQKIFKAINFSKLVDEYLGTQEEKSLENLNAYILRDPAIKEYLQRIIDKQMAYLESYNWKEVFRQIITKHPEAEIWFYQCQWGYRTTLVSDPILDRHLNTFGSMIRFHPFDDNDVDVILVRNIESLTSELDRGVVDRWLSSDKTFCVYAFPEYICSKHDIPIYNETCKGFEEEIMILAVINYNKKSKNNRFQNCINYDFIIDFIRKSKNTYVRTYVYGIDEVVLTKCVKPYLINNPDDFEIIYLTQSYDYLNSSDQEAYDRYRRFMSTRFFSSDEQRKLEQKKTMYKTAFIRNVSDYFPDFEIGMTNLFAYYYIYYAPAIFPGQGFRSKKLVKASMQKKAFSFYFPEKDKKTFYQQKYLKYKQKYLELKSRLSVV